MSIQGKFSGNLPGISIVGVNHKTNKKQVHTNVVKNRKTSIPPSINGSISPSSRCSPLHFLSSRSVEGRIQKSRTNSDVVSSDIMDRSEVNLNISILSFPFVQKKLILLSETEKVNFEELIKILELVIKYKELLMTCLDKRKEINKLCELIELLKSKIEISNSLLMQMKIIIKYVYLIVLIYYKV